MDGLLLSGGKNRRMGGRPKGELLFCGEMFAGRVAAELRREASRVMISYGEQKPRQIYGCEPVKDRYPGCGPIAGIHAGLCACKTEWMMAAACDMPLLKAELFWKLRQELTDSNSSGWEVVIPVNEGKLQPLCALWNKRAAACLEIQIISGQYRLKEAVSKLEALYVDITGQEAFTRMLENINTPGDYERLRG